MNSAKFYIVFQGEIQIGVVKQLNTPHYQLSIKEVVKFFIKNNFQLKCKLIFIGINENLFIKSFVMDEKYLQNKNIIKVFNNFSDKPNSIKF